MSIAFYNGVSGMRAFQSAMDVTSHNIANVNTNGYKARRAGFTDLLRSRINTNVAGQHLVGHGVKQQFVDTRHGQAGLDQTGYGLDFAITGEGFFAVEQGGEIRYTRNGAFDISVMDGNAYLTTNDGGYVLDKNGNRITLQAFGDGTFSTDGLLDSLGVYGFANPYGLTAAANSSFTVSDTSGMPVLLTAGGVGQGGYELRQGSLEFSGVELADEMVDVIASQRAYQMNARVVQTADTIAELINNLR